MLGNIDSPGKDGRSVIGVCVTKSELISAVQLNARRTTFLVGAFLSFVFCLPY